MVGLEAFVLHSNSWHKVSTEKPVLGLIHCFAVFPLFSISRKTALLHCLLWKTPMDLYLYLILKQPPGKLTVLHQVFGGFATAPWGINTGYFGTGTSVVLFGIEFVKLNFFRSIIFVLFKTKC